MKKWPASLAIKVFFVKIALVLPKGNIYDLCVLPILSQRILKWSVLESHHSGRLENFTASSRALLCDNNRFMLVFVFILSYCKYMAMKETVTACTVGCHSSIILQWTTDFFPVPPSHSFPSKSTNITIVGKTNHILVLLWKYFWPFRPYERFLGNPQEYKYPTLITADAQLLVPLHMELKVV